MLYVFTTIKTNKQKKNTSQGLLLFYLLISFRVSSCLEKFPMFDCLRPGKCWSQIPAITYKAQGTTKLQNKKRLLNPVLIITKEAYFQIQVQMSLFKFFFFYLTPSHSFLIEVPFHSSLGEW